MSDYFDIGKKNLVIKSSPLRFLVYSKYFADIFFDGLIVSYFHIFFDRNAMLFYVKYLNNLSEKHVKKYD